MLNVLSHTENKQAVGSSGAGPVRQKNTPELHDILANSSMLLQP